MRNWPEGVLWKLIAFGMLLATGCASGSGLIGVPHSGGISAPPPLPPTDAGLADHVPGRVVIRFQPESDPRTILGSIGGRVLRELKGFNAVVAEVPNGSSVVDTIRRLQAIPDVKYAEPEYVYRAFQAPNDPYFATKQWGPQKIGAVSAWTITTGANTLIAVLDTNVGNNFDFGPRFRGFHSCVASGGATDHGTHVAGIAGAQGNNSFGIAGMAWTANLASVEVLDVSGVGTTGSIVCGIEYVRDVLVSPLERVVANMSFGGTGYSQLMKDALDSTINAGVVFVAAAGNDGKATISYPAGYPGVIAVGAITPENHRATFSSYGTHLSIVAPGVEIYSTAGNDNFFYMTGTSQAAPHVSGVAALVLSLNPGFAPAQVRAQLEQTADDLGPAGFDPQFGWGRVDAAGAVGAPVASNLGSVRVTVLDGTALVADADVSIWSETPSCIGLSNMVKTARTGASGVAVFNDIPGGSYCATASKIVPPQKTGTTAAPFSVVAGAATTVSLSLGP